ncbi:MAG: hypothetical protein ACYDHP_08270 [Ferrimicrobium sp.]
MACVTFIGDAGRFGSQLESSVALAIVAMGVFYSVALQYRKDIIDYRSIAQAKSRRCVIVLRSLACATDWASLKRVGSISLALATGLTAPVEQVFRTLFLLSRSGMIQPYLGLWRITLAIY